MVKSPTRSAYQFSLAFGLLAAAWVIFTHFGPQYFMVVDQYHIHHDAPADALFAAVSTLVLYFVLRRYLTDQARSNEELRRSRDELEARVQERTRDLDAERTKLLRILDALPDGVCIVNQDYDLEYINPAMERQWGAIKGRKCYAYFAERGEPCPHCRLPSIVNGRTERWEWVSDTSGKTFDVVGATIREPNEDVGMLYIFHDITERVRARSRIEEMGAESARQAAELRHAHAQLSSRARELATLLEISHSISSTLQSQKLLEVILDQLKKMIDYSAAIVYWRDSDGITAVAYRGSLLEEKVVGLHIPIDFAPGFQLLLARREPIVVDDLYGEEPLARAIMLAAESHFPHTMGTSHSWMGVPLISNDRVIGMLRLDHAAIGHFSQHEAQIALAIANHAAVAMENSLLYEEAHKVAVLEERQRMARDLHDSVSQALYGIALGTHAAREQLGRSPEKLKGTLDYILAMSATAVAEMRALVFELRPDSLEQEGLTAALTKQADALQARAGVTVDLKIAEEPVISLDGKEILYRIAQEALQNVAKHAQASNVRLDLRQDGSWVLLEVLDDGVGFDTNGRFPGHYGLRSMHERALRLGGALEINSTPQAGTVVRARVPAALEMA